MAKKLTAKQMDARYEALAEAAEHLLLAMYTAARSTTCLKSTQIIGN